MPIYHSLKAIFIHIPKAGGTSIEETISDFPLFRQKLVNKYNWYGNIKHQNNQQTYELDHSTMAYLKNNCKYYDNNYFIFSVIRNPYARLVSEYHYCKYQYSRLIKNLNTFNDFVYELKEKFDYILKNKESNHLYVSHFLPQYLFTHNYRKQPLIPMENIYKLENIKDDWNKIKTKLNIDVDLKHTEKNASKFKYNYEDYYPSQELKEIVYELYKDDFIIFDYDK